MRRKEWLKNLASWIVLLLAVDTTSQSGYGVNTAKFTSTRGTGSYTGTLALSSLFGVASSIATSLRNIPILTENDLSYSDVEQKAKDIYDNIDKNHVTQPNEGSTLLVESEEAKQIIGKIINEMDSQNIQEGLNVMQKVYKRQEKNNLNF